MFWSLHLALFLLSSGDVTSAAGVSYSRDVLPILSDRCFHCHGPDDSHREADLRLDLEENAKAHRDGTPAIKPGDVSTSEIWQRISSDDEFEVMPPPDSHRKPLSQAEREIIRSWIESGAAWGKHWAFEPPVRPSVPKLAEHPVDAFILQKLDAEGLQLSPPAAAHTQLRRLSFDLTGMSPTVQEIEQFSQSPDDENWSRQIDRLLASPHYAERMAMWWLDAARYSDSDGYQQDSTRQNWPWRDWVVQAFSQNMPFDQFTIEQFAGDLLPEATPEQILATCFHRNHMTNGEGGRDPEESRIDYVIDRVNTVGTVWLGLTLGCVQCHSHKFDPISHQDYYALAAFFNSIDEDGKAGMRAKPYLKFASPQVTSRIEEMKQFITELTQREAHARASAVAKFDNWLVDLLDHRPENYVAWRIPKVAAQSSDGTQFRIEDDQTIQTFGPTPFQDDYRIRFHSDGQLQRVTGWRLEVFPDPEHIEGRFTRDGNGEFTLTNVRLLVKRHNSPTEHELEHAGAIADIERSKDDKGDWDSRYGSIAKTLNDDARDGWTTLGVAEVTPHVGVFRLEEPVLLNPGDELIVLLRHRSTHGRANIGRFRISITDELGETLTRTDSGSPVGELLMNWPEQPDQLSPQSKDRLREQYLLDDTTYQQAKELLNRARSQLKQLEEDAKPRSVMVLAERESPRETHVLLRGVWDAKGEVVAPAVLPAVLDQPMEPSASRLDLARWLVDDKNPLTARVVVNHIWQFMFGNGLVRTPDDLGLQGERPSHPELLDWLAVELIEHDWNLQHLIKLIATSRTYRQSSTVSQRLLELDPDNRLLARGPRYRLPAWMLRDNALRVSGLLNPAVGGPPVKPYQPEGVWAEITMGRFDYDPSVGPAQYRRTIYAYWRRSIAPVFLFDSAQRRVCEVGVRRTNTPLHALTLMNDPTLLEASRVLAERVVTDQALATFDSRLRELFLRVLSRSPQPDEVSELQEVWNQVFAYYQQHESEGQQFTTIGQQPPARKEVVAETAAWMTIASLTLNLDEAMSHE